MKNSDRQTSPRTLNPAATGGPTLPISSIGPDCYLDMYHISMYRTVLLVRRDENQAGWLVSQLEGRLATVTCGSGSLQDRPDWSNVVIDGFRFGTVDMTSIFEIDEAVHVEYEYLNETYTEDFPGLSDPPTLSASPAEEGDRVILSRIEPRVQLRVRADGTMCLEPAPTGE